MRYLDLSPSDLRDGLQVYPDHLYDTNRVAMAAEILGKEVAKLVVASNDDELGYIRKQVGDSFNGDRQEMYPVHDFWALCDSIKSKRLARFITARNIDWQLEETPLDELTLTWMPFMEKKPELYGPAPWPIPSIRKVFKDNPEEHAYAHGLNDAIKSHFGFYRSDDPITLVTIDDKQSLLMDGNGRLGTAVVDERETINVWHGRMNGPLPVDYWLSMSYLKDLCYQVQFEGADDPAIAKAAILLVRNAVETNEIARINYGMWLTELFPAVTDELTDVLEQPVTHLQ